MNSTPQVKHEIRDHSELGGSNASRWANCSGSTFLARLVPKRPTSAAADKGTHAHEACEIMLSDFLSHKMEGTAIDAVWATKKSTFSSEAQSYAQIYTRLIWEEVLKFAATNKAWGIEEKFVYNADFESAGIVDFWCIYTDDKSKRIGVVVDFKGGFGAVSVENNAQLAFYSVCLRRFVRSLGKDLDAIRTVIIQPGGEDQEVYKEALLSAKKLDSWERKFDKAAIQIYVKKKPIFKVGDHCCWCEGKAICKKYIAVMQEKAALQLVDVPSTIILAPPETLAPEKVVAFIKAFPMIKEYASGCTAYALACHDANKPLPGLKVVEGGSKRSWKENDEEVASGLQALGCSNPWKKTLRGIGEIERELGKGAATPFTVKPTGKPTIVEDTDERPAMTNLIDLLE